MPIRKLISPLECRALSRRNHILFELFRNKAQSFFYVTNNLQLLRRREMITSTHYKYSVLVLLKRRTFRSIIRPLRWLDLVLRGLYVAQHVGDNTPRRLGHYEPRHHLQTITLQPLVHTFRRILPASTTSPVVLPLAYSESTA